GQEAARLTGHTSAVYSVSFSPDGRRLAAAGQDRTVRVWDVSGFAPAAVRREPPTAREVEALWADLAGGDAARAYRSMGTLAAFPERTVPLLKERLRPAGRLEPAQRRQAERWVVDLDDEDFTVRQKATTGLADLGEAVLPVLREALPEAPSLEA